MEARELTVGDLRKLLSEPGEMDPMAYLLTGREVPHGFLACACGVEQGEIEALPLETYKQLIEKAIKVNVSFFALAETMSKNLSALMAAAGNGKVSADSMNASANLSNTDMLKQ